MRPFGFTGDLNSNLNRALIRLWLAGRLLIHLLALHPVNQLLYDGEFRHIGSIRNAPLLIIGQDEEDDYVIHHAPPPVVQVALENIDWL